MSRYLPPPAFHTFDPISKSPGELLEGISSSFEGKHRNLMEIVGENSILPELQEGKAPDIDAATILLICILEWQEGGGAPRPLDSGHSRERLGRFPSDDGNAVEYILDFTKDESGVMHSLLRKLGSGLIGSVSGELDFSRGAGGVELLGWLDVGEVPKLRKEIEKGGWSVLSNEPHDGGVQDALRHLLVFLRAAGRRKCGVLMRRHS
jgi:hypothetical protein|tara:strand:- start:23 stop:643 length:621 start_codon:yes stop_codon:yes gene_type:complete